VFCVVSSLLPTSSVAQRYHGASTDGTVLGLRFPPKQCVAATQAD
jgi:hypothetical protein